MSITYDNDSAIITFQSTERSIWIKQISESYELIKEKKNEITYVDLDFEQSLDITSLKPFHLVTTACLIQHFFQIGLKVRIIRNNEKVFDYIYNELDFPKYWGGGLNHVEAKTYRNIFNLWRIVESEKDLYAKNVEEYFRQNYFKNKDLSVISLSLIEAYYNVFDHASANGNAFSLIQYDEASSKLFVAISDFGIGITRSVRDFDSSIKNDKDAILKAIENNFTVKSTLRNRGFGLGNILTPAEEARIFSQNGLIYKDTNGEINSFETDLTFPGTLIYFEINLSNLEDEEYLDEFML